MSGILIPGYLRWDGTKYVLDSDVEIVGPAGPVGPAGQNGTAGTTGNGIGAYPSTRMAIDSNTYALWNCTKPISGNNIPNHPSAAGGSAMDLIIVSSALQGTYFDWVQDNRAIYGSCLSLISRNGNAVTNAPSWRSATSVVPPGNQFTFSAIFTPYSLSTAFALASIFMKTWTTGTWTSPFYAIMIGFNHLINSTTYPQSDLGLDTGSSVPDGYMRCNAPKAYVSHGQVHTIVVTLEYGAAQRRVYLDGILVNSELSTPTSAKNMGTGWWLIGAEQANHCEYMSGLYHECRVDTTLRDANWALEHYKRAVGIIQ